MITPNFSTTQESDIVIIKLRVPYVKISASEVLVQENSFMFYLKPYFLRLNFKQKLVGGEEGVRSAVYDHNTYYVTFELTKATPGEHFEDLDLVSKLFEKKIVTAKSKPNIQVIKETTNSEGEGKEIEVIDETEQEMKEYAIGFDRNYTDFFDNHPEELIELSDINPAATRIEDREKVLFFIEAQKFDPDHYVCNFHDSKEIDRLISLPLSIRIQGQPKLFSSLPAQPNIK